MLNTPAELVTGAFITITSLKYIPAILWCKWYVNTNLRRLCKPHTFHIHRQQRLYQYRYQYVLHGIYE